MTQKALDANRERIAAALRPFGWTCTDEFWKRYYTDAWVYNLANAVAALTEREVVKDPVTMSAPTICVYCDGHGNSSFGGDCGFCENGIPLDTVEDWKRTWGGVFDRVFDRLRAMKTGDRDV